MPAKHLKISYQFEPYEDKENPNLKWSCNVWIADDNGIVAHEDHAGVSKDEAFHLAVEFAFSDITILPDGEIR